MLLSLRVGDTRIRYFTATLTPLNADNARTAVSLPSETVLFYAREIYASSEFVCAFALLYIYAECAILLSLCQVQVVKNVLAPLYLVRYRLVGSYTGTQGL